MKHRSKRKCPLLIGDKLQNSALAFSAISRASLRVRVMKTRAVFESLGFLEDWRQSPTNVPPTTMISAIFA
jgi:hypothetical protein